MRNDTTELRQTVILAPSLIASRKRHNLAVASLKSLRQGIGGDIPLYVVHDNPTRPRLLPVALSGLLPAVRWDRTAESVYSGSNIRLIRRVGCGSASALREAVAAASVNGASYGFIHLDDQVYREDFRILMAHGLDALANDPDLLWVRYSGYPLICKDRPRLEVVSNRLSFDTVNLKPARRENYTLWWSPLEPDLIRGRYWPVAMWFCIYRLPLLAQLLDWALADGALHLAHVELYYKQEQGFTRLQRAYPTGRFGYVNMQYGGIEMHRNANWRELMSLPNEPVL